MQSKLFTDKSGASQSLKPAPEKSFLFFRFLRTILLKYKDIAVLESLLQIGNEPDMYKDAIVFLPIAYEPLAKVL